MFIAIELCGWQVCWAWCAMEPRQGSGDNVESLQEQRVHVLCNTHNCDRVDKVARVWGCMWRRRRRRWGDGSTMECTDPPSDKSPALALFHKRCRPREQQACPTTVVIMGSRGKRWGFSVFFYNITGPLTWNSFTPRGHERNVALIWWGISSYLGLGLQPGCRKSNKCTVFFPSNGKS